MTHVIAHTPQGTYYGKQSANTVEETKDFLLNSDKAVVMWLSPPIGDPDAQRVLVLTGDALSSTVFRIEEVYED